MNTEALAARVYRQGFKPEDFAPTLMRDGIVIVAPIRPPTVLEGIIVGHVDIPGTAALLYRVVASAPPDRTPAGGLSVRPGDVVVLRQAHLDPIQPDRDLLSIKAEHILAIVPEPKEG